MALGYATVLLIAVASVLGVGWLVVVRRRVTSDPGRRRRWTAAIVGCTALSLAVIAIAASLLLGGPDYSKPVPEFPSLAAHPDRALHGTVAYVVVSKDVATKTQSECARVSLASGTASKDVLCWPFSHTSPATVKWLADHRLLVTVFSTAPKTHGLNPAWAKIIDVTSGGTQVVPDSEVGRGATPSSGPRTNAAGVTAIASGKDGNLTLTVRERAGTRTLLSVRNSNAGWGIQSGPAWSPDGKWILWSDGGRLLVTTAGTQPTTRILSTAEVFGLAAEYGIQVFALIGADLPME